MLLVAVGPANRLLVAVVAETGACIATSFRHKWKVFGALSAFVLRTLQKPLRLLDLNFVAA